MKSIIIALVLAAFAVNGQALAYTEQRTMKLDAGGIRTLDISCGAGELVVEGQERQDIEVGAKIEIDEISAEKAGDFIEKQVDLWLRKDGDLARLKSEIEGGFRNRANARIHLRVAVPRQMNLVVKDGSGSVEVHSIRADLDIRDGSGSIEVRNAAGNQVIIDGSGEITLEAIQGDVTIRDGSGGIAVRNILGNLDITDGSGSIQVSGVGGSVRVNDGSGSMVIRDVEKDVTVVSDTSGSRTISGVKGTVVARD